MTDKNESPSLSDPLEMSTPEGPRQGPWGNRTGGSGGNGGGGGNDGRGDGRNGNGGRDNDFGGGRQRDGPGDQIEELMTALYERLRKRFGGGGGGSGGGVKPRQIGIVLVVVLLLWLFSGLYRVNPGEQGVVLRFGQWTNQGALAEEGLHWHLPWPFESAVTPQVEEVRQIDVGFRGTNASDVAEESLMLTGDQNIIDIDFTVQWRILDAGEYLFNIRDPDATIKIAAESAMRETIGRTGIQPALTEGRAEIASKTRETLQRILNEYDSGILVTQVTLQEAQPPEPVIDAFEDVQRARQDLERLRNQAGAYANKIIPEARGEAQRIMQGAEGYRARVIAEALGEGERFDLVYEAYKASPGVTARRLYLETMEEILASGDKVILRGDGTGALPVLPLQVRPQLPASLLPGALSQP